jgi:DtxR family Mn-dependent transcriptional regulator
MTKSLEDYIEEIHLLIRDCGQARVRDVARALGVKMPSVVKAIAELKKRGLVTQEPYESIKLTMEGVRAAEMVLERHTLLKAFLLKLGVGEANAEHDACLMEHILCAETIECVREFVGASVIRGGSCRRRRTLGAGEKNKNA